MIIKLVLRTLCKTEDDVVFLTGFYLIPSFGILRRTCDHSVINEIREVAAHLRALLIRHLDREHLPVDHRNGQRLIGAERQKALQDPVAVI